MKRFIVQALATLFISSSSALATSKPAPDTAGHQTPGSSTPFIALRRAPSKTALSIAASSTPDSEMAALNLDDQPHPHENSILGQLLSIGTRFKKQPSNQNLKSNPQQLSENPSDHQAHPRAHFSLEASHDPRPRTSSGGSGKSASLNSGNPTSPQNSPQLLRSSSNPELRALTLIATEDGQPPQTEPQTSRTSQAHSLARIKALFSSTPTQEPSSEPTPDQISHSTSGGSQPSSPRSTASLSRPSSTRVSPFTVIAEEDSERTQLSHGHSSRRRNLIYTLDTQDPVLWEALRMAYQGVSSPSQHGETGGASEVYIPYGQCQNRDQLLARVTTEIEKFAATGQSEIVQSLQTALGLIEAHGEFAQDSEDFISSLKPETLLWEALLRENSNNEALIYKNYGRCRTLDDVFFEALRRNHNGAVYTLLEIRSLPDNINIFNINGTNLTGESALSITAQKGNLELLEHLINCGARKGLGFIIATFARQAEKAQSREALEICTKTIKILTKAIPEI